VRFRTSLFLFFGCAISALSARGGPEIFRATSEVRSVSSDVRFEQFHLELSLVSGALFSPADLGRHFFPHTQTNFDYTQSELRFGVMLNSPWEAGFLRGNFEALVGIGGGAVIYGPGTGLANGDLFIRYNFVQPHAVAVPFWQLGLGLNGSDVASDHSQRVIGNPLEFTLQTSLGLRILIVPRWSLDLEAIYQHISNAGLADRNVGVNALGGLAGTTYSF
jgi:hypothetical protein